MRPLLITLLFSAALSAQETPVAHRGSVENRLGDKKGPNGLPLNPYFNINAFQPLPNISFFKRFAIREQLGLQLRLETSNFFNTRLEF